MRRILVAVKDLQVKASPAVAKGAQLARAWGGTLELFHALDMVLYVDAYRGTSLASMMQNLRSQGLERLETIADGLRREGMKVNVSAEWDFPVYEAIVRRARRCKADLIVAETHRARHRFPLLLHITDWQLLHWSPVPVLLVKTSRPYHRPVVLAALDPTHAFAKPAKLDAEILRIGSAVTHALRGTLHAVHGYAPFSPNLVSQDVSVTQAAGRIATQAAQARSAFEKVLRRTKIPRARRHLTSEYAVRAIERTARDTHSSIVVMGAISRSGWKRFFIGNTAENVLDRLRCDILVVKPTRFVSRVPAGRSGPRLAIYEMGSYP